MFDTSNKIAMRAGQVIRTSCGDDPDGYRTINAIFHLMHGTGVTSVDAGAWALLEAARQLLQPDPGAFERIAREVLMDAAMVDFDIATVRAANDT